MQLDEERAVVTAVEPGTAAANAGVHIGDEIVAVEGKPLVGSAGELATRRLFGKVADQLHISVLSGTIDKTVVVVLAAKPR